MPIEAQVRPLPSELTTPPVTKICFAMSPLTQTDHLFTRDARSITFAMGEGSARALVGSPGLALSQGMAVEGAEDLAPIRVALIGLGNRGTGLLRALLELPAAPVVAVCDLEAKHRLRAQGIAEKARGVRPDAYERVAQVLER